MNKLTPKEGRDLTKDIIYLCEDKAFLESIIDEYVWLIDDKTVEVGEKSFEFKSIIIATGARAKEFPGIAFAGSTV